MPNGYQTVGLSVHQTKPPGGVDNIHSSKIERANTKKGKMGYQPQKEKKPPQAGT